MLGTHITLFVTTKETRMMTLPKGTLIALEGIDGSGKSTLARNMYTHYVSKGVDALLTREPGASGLGKKLRTILQEKEVNVGAKAEFLLFAADRAQHFEELIIPALRDHKLIISDRLADSSIIYQGYGRGLPIEFIQQVNAWVMNTIKPDITIYVQVPIEVALKRIIKRKESLSSFERERIDFVERLITGFETLFNNRTDVITVNGQLPPEELAEISYHQVQSFLVREERVSCCS
jgi:dTMP kinase